MMEQTGTDREHWSRVAAEWIAWARTPNHDAFWAYRDQLAGYIGRGDGEAVDVGCGEGRVSRLLRSCGYRVTAVDPVADLLQAAEEANSADRYAIAPAGGLPFEDGSFDLAVAYNMLMDVDDLPKAVEEISRVLRPSGTLVVSVVHPLADLYLPGASGAESPSEPDESYFATRRFDTTVQASGLQMRFAGWARPLQEYAAALEGAGLAIVSVREPVPDLGEGRDHLRRWSHLPLFLWLKARRLDPDRRT